MREIGRNKRECVRVRKFVRANHNRYYVTMPDNTLHKRDCKCKFKRRSYNGPYNNAKTALT